MANRGFKSQFQYGFEAMPVNIYVNFLGNGTGAPTVYKWTGSALSATTTGYNGLKSITRNGTGDYTFAFDNYNRLLDVSLNVLSVDGTTTPAASAYWIKAMTSTASQATVRLVFYLNATGTPVDPTTNDLWSGCFTFSNSSAH
jgi:hypothetical protein